MMTTESAKNSVSSCSSSSSSSSSYVSCINSTICTHSLAASSNSSSFYPSQSRCEGLDLLVKAAYYVSGSAVGVPYFQKRVIRRRKRALKFSNLIFSNCSRDKKESHDKKERGRESEINDDSEQMKQRRAMALPSKYQDSVLLYPWKPRSHRRRSSNI
ncbi:hypothetical protein Nepgr_013148 [Nepenthes gracilis]|uniref:Uncharacterized protein n=1 Tax=Nepenthes gracilis TaxID=150966 RepID=A0AAD3XNE3_NEPGR|nr:hypothetical protein Nepgr_013148 [Nepenthes gracilis]